MLSLVCFLVGGLLGWGAAQGGERVQRVWPIALRVQILVTSASLSLVAAWRLNSASELVGPLDSSPDCHTGSRTVAVLPLNGTGHSRSSTVTTLVARAGYGSG